MCETIDLSWGIYVDNDLKRILGGGDYDWNGGVDDDDNEDGDVLGDNLGGLMASILRSEFSRGQPLY